MEAARILPVLPEIPRPELSMVDRISDDRKRINGAIDHHVTVEEPPRLEEVEQKFGRHGRQVQEKYLELLHYGGGRTRGIEVMIGCEAFGGTDLVPAVRAGLATELIQTSLLILDDMDDKADLRRGIPTLHLLFGESAARSVAQQGIERAKDMLGRLSGVPEETRLRILLMAGKTLDRTGYGQIADNHYKASELPPDSKIPYAIMESKTAHYTISGPLQIGILLSNSGALQDRIRAAQAIEPFGRDMGIAYQLWNDLKLMDKNDTSDIQGDSPTVLMQYALAHATSEQTVFLRSILGRQVIEPQDMKMCQAVLTDCGAVAHVQEKIRTLRQTAVQSLPSTWPPEQREFLTQALEHLLVT